MVDGALIVLLVSVVTLLWAILRGMFLLGVLAYLVAGFAFRRHMLHRPDVSPPYISTTGVLLWPLGAVVIFVVFLRSFKKEHRFRVSFGPDLFQDRDSRTFPSSAWQEAVAFARDKVVECGEDNVYLVDRARYTTRGIPNWVTYHVSPSGTVRKRNDQHERRGCHMVPTPEELVALNPELAGRTREDLQRLIDTIVAHGWRWDARSASFVNDTLKTGLRTLGLDLFTPETFEWDHAEMMANPAATARSYRGVRVFQRWGTFAILLLIGDLLVGWLVFSWRTWFTSLIVLAAFLILLYRYMRRGGEGLKRARDGAGRWQRRLPQGVDARERARDEWQPFLAGFDGWLGVLAIAVIVMPIRFMAVLPDLLKTFDTNAWELLTTPGSPVYHPLSQPFLIAELGANLALLVWSAFLVYLFFRKKRGFPRSAIAFIVANAAFYVSDMLISRRIAESVPLLKADAASVAPSALVGGFVGSVIWIAYLLRSNRVRTTFVK